MARPTPPSRKELYRHNVTRYIYCVAHKTTVRIESAATPAPPAFDLFTLKFEGRHPEDENTIVVSAADLADNFTIYQPIQADRPTAHKPSNETV